MRYLLPILLALGLAGCAGPYYGGYAYDGYSGYAPAYAYGYGPQNYGPAYASENCGTPYEWKACPDRRYRRY